MSHDLTVRQDETVEMFSAGREPVWHKLGQRTETAVTSAAAIRMAGLDWQVRQQSIAVLNDDESVDAGIPINTHKAIVRCDNDHVLGIVGRRYTPIQNEEAFEWLDSVVGKRLAIYETAGSLHGGKVVWMMVRLPNELRVEGTDDISHPYLLLCNSHDGTRALRVLNTSVRVVCNNTLTWALRKGEGSGLSIRHTELIRDRIREARNTLGVATRQFEKTQGQMNAMNRRQLSGDDLVKYFEVVWPDNPEVEDTSRSKAAREQMLANFENEAQQLAGIRGTAWAAYNSVSQYTDWQRPSRGHSDAQRHHNRLASMWFGSSAVVKRRAWKEAVKVARS
jgi:phage/plasmid-like protein (TIGR03299 family)